MAVSVFISYAHEDASLARALAAALRRRKCKVWIDEGEMRVGDSLIERIATAIKEVHFVVALVSEASAESKWCQKELSLAITGGLGREGVKVLPLRVGDAAMPPALSDVFWLPLDADSVGDAATRIKRDAEAHLASTERPKAPPTPQQTPQPAPARCESMQPSTRQDLEEFHFEPVKIVGIVREGVGKPRNDGTRGSALYDVPLRLSRRPPPGWGEVFVRNWDRPPSFTTMHRPGICRVYGDTVVIVGTTMDELESYHSRTLKLALAETNRQYEAYARREFEKKKREQESEHRHRREIDEISDRLRFDDEE